MSKYNDVLCFDHKHLRKITIRDVELKQLIYELILSELIYTKFE